MKKGTRNVLRGIGSLIDIMPSNGLNKAIARQHASDDVASHFGRVAVALKDACARFENDVKISTNKK
ncbi:hypothetical protein [Nitrosomonas sp. Nm132]|uniref:hypothetical protein n=1 Tax=Nitrosomonas sp. Nm132 TaxID=1881053 RepID=UPI000888FBB4|nr:hypothetical protein [Nitrosomonas sp. Nm132]SDH25756.1 hypothetical protein SAMN05428952_100922 [Nitrosomonas sp. Nm132]